MLVATEHYILGETLHVAEAFRVHENDINYVCRKDFDRSYIDAEVGCSLDIVIAGTPITLKYRNDTRPAMFNEYHEDGFVVVNDGVLGKIYASTGEFEDDKLAEVIKELSEIGLMNVDKQGVAELYKVMQSYAPNLQDSLNIECGSVGDYEYGVYEGDNEHMTFYSYNDLAHDARVSEIRPSK